MSQVTKRGAHRKRAEAMSAPRAAFPMRTVMRMTGLSADTIRVWERRYRAVTPQRTSGNARRYTDAQIARLNLLREAISRGHTIGEIAMHDDEALAELGRDAPPRALELSPPTLATRYLEALERYDLAGANAVLKQAAALMPARALALEVLRPITTAVGEAWHQGALSISQEHVATQQIRALAESLARVHDVAPSARKLLFAAPEGHLHDLGLHLCGLIALEHGVAPIMLGANTPLAEVERAATRLRARHVVLSVARDLDAGERRTLPARIRALARRVEVWLGVPVDHPLGSLASRENVRVFHSFESFDRALSAYAPT